MKRFFSVLFSVVLLISALFVPASAAEVYTFTWQLTTTTFHCDSALPAGRYEVSSVTASSVVDFLPLQIDITYSDYVVDDVTTSYAYIPVFLLVGNTPKSASLILMTSNGSSDVLIFDSSDSFTTFDIDSFTLVPVESEWSLYDSCYDLLKEHIYGADVELTESMELTLTVCATIGSLFVVALPFLVVWFFIRRFF